jgi:hypothetical protein
MPTDRRLVYNTLPNGYIRKCSFMIHLLIEFVTINEHRRIGDIEDEQHDENDGYTSFDACWELQKPCADGVLCL